MPSVTSVKAKRAALGGVDEVAAERQFAPPRIGRPVDRADHRHRAGEKGADHALEQQMLVLPRFVGHAVALFQVAAGAKGALAGTRQHDAPVLRGGGVDRVEKREQITPHPGVERIRRLRPVERQQHEPAATVL